MTMSPGPPPAPSSVPPPPGGRARLPAGTFLFVRHGETTANRDGVICGGTDRPLTRRGEAQARGAAARIAGFEPDAAITTPLRRARRTAELCLSGTRLTAVPDPRLQERDWGRLEGQALSRIVPYGETPPGGESWSAFTARVVDGLTEALAHARPVVIAHSGVHRVLRWLATGDPAGPRIANGQPVVVVIPEEGGTWSFTPLEEDIPSIGTR